MNIFRTLAALFPPPVPRKTVHERKNGRAHRLVSMFARGNIRLQQGEYLMQSDIDKLRKACCR